MAWLSLSKKSEKLPTQRPSRLQISFSAYAEKTYSSSAKLRISLINIWVYLERLRSLLSFLFFFVFETSFSFEFAKNSWFSITWMNRFSISCTWMSWTSQLIDKRALAMQNCLSVLNKRIPYKCCDLRLAYS